MITANTINFLIFICFVLSLYFILNIIFTLKKKSKYYLWHMINLVLDIFLIIFGFYTHNILNSDTRIDINNYIFLYFLVSFFIMFVIDIASRIIFKLEKEKKKFFEEKKQFEYENALLLVEAEHKTTELELKVKELEDTKAGMINILEDVNEQKDRLSISEKQLSKMAIELDRSNKKLMNLDKQKDQFTSITAHELKTPLASIHGFVQLLKNESIIKDKQKRENYMNIILSDTERLSKLITDILDISRMDLGTLKFYFENVDVKNLMQKIENEMTMVLKDKNIKYKFKVDDSTPKTIFADPDRLSQVITNLINNAVHYTPEKGKIIIEAKKSGPKVMFSVSDTGQGIPPKEINNIFERFYQVDGWLTRKIGGSGLGLAICKGLVKAMGGTIKVKSVLGKGSTFYFTIPYREKKNVEKYVNIFDNKDNEKKRIK